MVKESSDRASGNGSLLRLCYCIDELRSYGKCVSHVTSVCRLLTGGLQREIPVFGFIKGQVVVGIIVSKHTVFDLTVDESI